MGAAKMLAFCVLGVSLSGALTVLCVAWAMIGNPYGVAFLITGLIGMTVFGRLGVKASKEFNRVNS